MIKIEITGEDMETVKTQAASVFGGGVSEGMSLDDVLAGFSLQEAVAALTMKADAEGYDLTLARKGSPAEQKKAEAKAKLRGELIDSLKEVNKEVAEIEEVEAEVVEPAPAEPEKPAKKARKAKGSNGAAETPAASESPAARKTRCLEKMRVLWSTNKKAVEGLAKKYASGDTRKFVLLPEETFEGISAELEGIE